MSERQTISVVVPTKNSAGVLRDCLASVAWADEILVVDMHSVDGTQEICARHAQCRVFERDDYIFANVNYGFDQATGDWVMRLDSDERITPELAAEIREILARPPDGAADAAHFELLRTGQSPVSIADLDPTELIRQAALAFQRSNNRCPPPARGATFATTRKRWPLP